jgi:hypothetical protein
VIAESGGKPPHSHKNVNRGVHIRAATFVDVAGVAAFSNCIEYTLEMHDEAMTARRERRGNSESVFAKCGRLVTIRKSDVVDFEGVAVISNCTRCRLEMRVRRFGAI